MIPFYRHQFNQNFSKEKHQKLIGLIENQADMTLAFKVSESPIFLSKSFRDQVMDVSQSIIQQIQSLSNEELQQAIPPKFWTNQDTNQPHFLILDYGICYDDHQLPSPQLIELQAFPSLFAFMETLKTSYAEIYPFLKELNESIPTENYFSELNKLIVADASTENVILMEIYPEKQKTAIDFRLTEKMLGIPTVCISKIQKKGKNLYYERNGQLIRIDRIYNRVIFEELANYPDLKLNFDFNEKLDVEWITHPNWFFKISKFILPKLQHKLIPKTYFLNEFPKSENLTDYVLKPLYSFAGKGVNLHPDQNFINNIDDKENYILQKRMKYAPIFEDVTGNFSKAELRMMFLWHPQNKQPQYIMNLVRMSRSDLLNMSQTGELWTGVSHAFFCPT